MYVSIGTIGHVIVETLTVVVGNLGVHMMPSTRLLTTRPLTYLAIVLRRQREIEILGLNFAAL
jgi:hypothetical protein